MGSTHHSTSDANRRRAAFGEADEGASDAAGDATPMDISPGDTLPVSAISMHARAGGATGGAEHDERMLDLPQGIGPFLTCQEDDSSAGTVEPLDKCDHRAQSCAWFESKAASIVHPAAQFNTRGSPWRIPCCPFAAKKFSHPRELRLTIGTSLAHAEGKGRCRNLQWLASFSLEREISVSRSSCS